MPGTVLGSLHIRYGPWPHMAPTELTGHPKLISFYAATRTLKIALWLTLFLLDRAHLKCIQLLSTLLVLLTLFLRTGSMRRNLNHPPVCNVHSWDLLCWLRQDAHPQTSDHNLRLCGKRCLSMVSSRLCAHSYTSLATSMERLEI